MNIAQVKPEMNWLYTRYHIDMKHNTYWELEEQVRDTLIKEKNLSEAEYKEDRQKVIFVKSLSRITKVS